MLSPPRAPGLASLLLVGLAASFFFSSTFVLNRWVSLEGHNHWFWTASLRHLFTFALLSLLLLRRGPALLGECLRCLRDHLGFWLVAGGVGFGVFYCALCFAASFAPGWIIATTWQTTILLTPLVLWGFGQPVPWRGLVYTLIVFAGIVLVNADHFSALSPEMAGAILPVLVAALSYPLGNSLVGFAKDGTDTPRTPHIDRPLMQHTLCRVWLMTAGALPLLLLLGLVLQPPSPSPQQLGSTLYIAVSTGLIGTGLFLYARHNATGAFQIAAVDATLAGEMLFALLTEPLLAKVEGFEGLRGASPSWLGAGGVLLILLGLGLYTWAGRGEKENKPYTSNA